MVRSNLESSRFDDIRWLSGKWTGVRKYLTGNFEILRGGPPVYCLDADGTDRIIFLPGFELGLVFLVFNVGGAGKLTIRDSNGQDLTDVRPGGGTLVYATDDEWGLLSGGGGGIALVRVADGTITVDPDDDDHILCDTGVCTVNLPPCSEREEGREYLVVDYGLDADTNTKTIVPDGSETILGLAQWELNAPGASITLKPRPDGTGWYS